MKQEKVGVKGLANALLLQLQLQMLLDTQALHRCSKSNLKSKYRKTVPSSMVFRSATSENDAMLRDNKDDNHLHQLNSVIRKAAVTPGQNPSKLDHRRSASAAESEAAANFRPLILCHHEHVNGRRI
jgi:hypothetical protein